MTVTLNSSPLVLATLQNLSGPRTGNGMARSLSRLKASTSEVRAFGGLDLQIQRGGKAAPSKVRYGAITITPRAQGSAFSRSPGVNTVVDRAYDNPGVRFGDHVRGRGRPISAAGETSCHFSQTSVSKTSPIREMISAARSGRRRTGSKAAAHVEYIERDGAPEKIDKYELLYGARFTAEMERRAAERSATAQQDYIERAGAAEGIERDPSRRITDEDLDELEEASFGTIGKTVEERRRFWHAVEAAEASPKGDRITIKPGENPAWWAKAVDAIDRAPATAQRELKDARERADGEPFELKLPTDKAFALHQWAISLDAEAPIEVSPGRGGRTQTRVIAELPHELDGRERLQVVRDFTDKLAEKGFPFWAVVHAPDQNNDARNYHVHIAYYDRPSQRMKTASGKDVWDFEIQEERRYPNRTKYLVRPHQQNRLRETNNQDWIAELRSHWETVTNAVLKDAGHTKRYNLGTYESMGISLEPQKHINPKTFNKERKGELTDEGPILARRQWDAEQENVLRDHQHQAARRFRKINALADQARAGMERHPRSELTKAIVEKLRERGLEASTIKAKADLLRDLGRVVMDRVMSRPKLILIEAIKQDDKAKKKFGLSDDVVAGDRPIPTGRIFGAETRNELAELVVNMSDQAVHLDTEHSRLVQVANTRLRVIVQELTSWAEKPMQPVTAQHVVRLQSSQAVDPIEQERQRQARIAAIQAGFMQELRKTLPEFLQTVSERVARNTPTIAERDNGSGVAGQQGHPPVALAPSQPSPQRALETKTATEPNRSNAKPQAETAAIPAERPAPVTFERHAMDSNVGRPTPVREGRRSDGRPAPRATPVTKTDEAQTGTASLSPAETSAPAKTRTPAPRAGASSPVDTAKTTQAVEANKPAQRENLRAQLRPDAGVTSPERANLRSARTGQSTNAPAAALGTQDQKPAPAVAKPVAPAARAVPVAPSSDAKPTPTAPVTAPTRQNAATRSTQTSPRESQPASQAPALPGAGRRSPGQTADPATPAQAAKPRYRGPSLPNIAAIMDEVESRKTAAKGPAVEPLVTSPFTTGVKEEDEDFRPENVEITGAKRPPKKQMPRQRQRTRDTDFER